MVSASRGGRAVESALERRVIPVKKRRLKSFTEQFRRALRSSIIPHFVRRHRKILTFPEKLMLMIAHVGRHHGMASREAGKSERDASTPAVEWVANGTVLVIRNKSELFRRWVPLVFREKKRKRFAQVARSFARNLTKWGIRSVAIPQGESSSGGAMYYGNEYFLQDFPELIRRMMRCHSAPEETIQSSQQATQHKSIADCQLGQDACSRTAKRIFVLNAAIQSKVGLSSVVVPRPCPQQAPIRGVAMESESTTRIALASSRGLIEMRRSHVSVDSPYQFALPSHSVVG